MYPIHCHGPYSCCLVSFFELHVLFVLTCIIVYGLLSWIIIIFCIYLWYFLVIGSWIFFCLVYICVTFFVTHVIYIFFETYNHVVMVINSKLVIVHDILKNISA